MKLALIHACWIWGKHWMSTNHHIMGMQASYHVTNYANATCLKLWLKVMVSGTSKYRKPAALVAWWSNQSGRFVAFDGGQCGPHGGSIAKHDRHKHAAWQAATAFLKANNTEIISHNIPDDEMAAAAAQYPLLVKALSNPVGGGRCQRWKVNSLTSPYAKKVFPHHDASRSE